MSSTFSTGAHSRSTYNLNKQTFKMYSMSGFHIFRAELLKFNEIRSSKEETFKRL